MSDHDGGGVTKLPELTGLEDYINWRRCEKPYIQRNDTEPFGLTDRPDTENSRVQNHYLNFMIRAKSKITLTLLYGSIAQVSSIVDLDNRTEKDL